MFENFTSLPSKAIYLFGGAGRSNDVPGILRALEAALHTEWRDSLLLLTGAPFLDPDKNEALHASISNLTDCHTAVRLLVQSAGEPDPVNAADTIGSLLTITKSLFRDTTGGNECASNIAAKTWNLLFAAGQKLQSCYRIKVVPIAKAVAPEKSLRISSTHSSNRVMEVPSAMLFELRQSLFPAERMIVGAGRREGNKVTIEGLFDVTGVASAGGVKAHPERLSRALIAMSISGTYFALWIHSHPGGGPGCTHPSSIDLRQHADWLKNYSADLVSAIMVADGHFRFWGTALDERTIAVSISGTGVVPVSANEKVFKLEA